MGKGRKRREKPDSNLKKADICGVLGAFWDFWDFAAKQRVQDGRSLDWKTADVADVAEEDEDMYEEDFVHSFISRIHAL